MPRAVFRAWHSPCNSCALWPDLVYRPSSWFLFPNLGLPSRTRFRGTAGFGTDRAYAGRHILDAKPYDSCRAMAGLLPSASIQNVGTAERIDRCDYRDFTDCDRIRPSRSIQLASFWQRL